MARPYATTIKHLMPFILIFAAFTYSIVSHCIKHSRSVLFFQYRSGYAHCRRTSNSYSKWVAKMQYTT